MDKLEPEDPNNIGRLKARIAFLESTNRWYFHAMDLVTSLGTLHQTMKHDGNHFKLFETTQKYLTELIPLKTFGFFLVNSENSQFELDYCHPHSEKLQLKYLVEDEVEKGTFAWALKQSKPLVLEKETSSSKIKMIFHSIITNTRILGMFVGITDSNQNQIFQERLNMVSIVLNHLAYALENGIYYKMVKEQKMDLKMKVINRTIELEKQKAELQKNNQNLQDFVFFASHDLQEPLRKVSIFGDLLKKHLNTNDEKIKGYMERIEKSTVRMKNLIDGLLQMSRITTRGNPFKSTEISKVVSQVLDELEMEIKKSNAQIQVGTLPTVEGDQLQLGLLFHNLIGNSLKFKNKDSQPKIKIWGEPCDKGLWKIYVQDNGIGFDEKYCQRIFKPFERLVGRSEYNGNGMGLSICKKIVDRHDGEISVNSKLNNGTVFSITLPELQSPLDSSLLSL